MDRVDELARIVWDYHLMHHPLRPADGIFVLGSNDLRVAEWAGDLYLRGLAPFIVVSGNSGALTRHLFTRTEAEEFRDVMVGRGVPEDAVLLEPRATNTGDNVLFTRELLAARGLRVRTLICVQKPYMERRTFTVVRKLWPELDAVISSPPIRYGEYPNETVDRDTLVNIMVGDLQRIMEYPKLGFQIPQEVPPEVRAAYEELIALGYDRHLAKIS
jgi:uncharacterized SAM-binding protein YcdF (DUF218 family)